jgi:hypothetical protein
MIISTITPFINNLKPNQMNVLKLIRCFWKHPITRTETKAVNYYIQYERVNHIIHPVYGGYGPFKYLIKHEDDIDLEIYKQLYQDLSNIANIQQFNIYSDEILLINESEERHRALFSNMAFGYNFRKLNINSLSNSIVSLSTRIMFYDIKDELVRSTITNSIPMSLNLDLTGKIPSLINAPFLTQQQVDQILIRENGDYSINP